MNFSGSSSAALVRRNLDLPLCLLTFGWMLGVLVYGAMSARIAMPLAVAFHYGFLAWLAVPVAAAAMCLRMMRLRQRATSTWRYWYRRGLVGAVLLTCLYVLGVCVLFFRGVGVPVDAQVRYEPPAAAVTVRYEITSRQWNARGERADASVAMAGWTDLSGGVTADFAAMDADGRRLSGGECAVLVNGREAARGAGLCHVGGAYYTPWGGVGWRNG